MKKHILIGSLALVGLVACGKKDRDKNNTDPGQNSDLSPVGFDDLEDNDDFDFGDNDSSNNECPNQSVNQSDDCDNDDLNPAPAQRLVVKKTSSWRYTDNLPLNEIKTSETCLDLFNVETRTFEIRLKNMDLRDERRDDGRAARCLAQIQVEYPRGFTFGIRRVELSLKSDVKAGAGARFEGSYQTSGKTASRVSEVITATGSRETTVNELFSGNEFQWASCSGQTTISLNSALMMNDREDILNQNNRRNSSAVGDYGTFSIDASRPYRFEVIWAKCQ